ncbi:MAG: hypothetical protein GTO16_05905 [Candidatus Aminicenantes bacterium]|nr:hypothetical protein [Candidatus Aminicenantes bacterium]
MNPPGKKFISLFLIFSLMMLSVNLHAKERRGAKLIITRTDGQLIEGELITVKPKSLLLLDAEGKDVSINIEDIEVIRIVKKSKFLLGVGSGAVAGLIIGSVSYKEPRVALIDYGPLFALIGVALGGLIGLVIGAAVGTDKTIQIEGMTDSEIQEALKKLRKKARIRDYK